MVEAVAENIYLIDDRVCSIPRLGSVYLLNEESKALIDSGPPNSAAAVLDGIRKAGVSPEDIDYIVVTHIHLDHAGGVGVLLNSMPRAQVVVHNRGAKHLARLTYLVASAVRTQGTRIVEQYGEVVPIEPGRMIAVNDEDTIRLGEGQALDFMDAPGHAPHELCIFERRNRGIFVGDAVGLYLAGGSVLLPCHPPPSFDMEMSMSTIRRLMSLSPARLFFAHFGVSNRPQEILHLAIDQMQEYAGMVAEAVTQHSADGLVRELAARLRLGLEPLKKEPAVYKLVSEDLLPSGIRGFIDYYSKKHSS